MNGRRSYFIRTVVAYLFKVINLIFLNQKPFKKWYWPKRYWQLQAWSLKFLQNSLQRKIHYFLTASSALICLNSAKSNQKSTNSLLMVSLLDHLFKVFNLFNSVFVLNIMFFIKLKRYFIRSLSMGLELLSSLFFNSVEDILWLVILNLR